MKKELTFKRKLQFTIVSVLLISFILLLLGEIGIRIMVAMRAAGYPTATTTPHDKLGWTAKPDFVFDGLVQDGAGTDQELHFSTDENSFKYFGEVNSDKKKLLVIGDSYTHAIEVSNDKTYYGLLRDSLPDVELFAFGARGIGPTQQYLWLEDWHSKIKPDAIIWQFCFNDVFNCSYELESTSYFNNNRQRRPYLEAGEINYRNPARMGMGGLRRNLKFLDFMFTKIEGIFESNDHKSETASEDRVQKEGKNYPPYQQALEAVDLSLKKAKALTGSIPIIALQTDLTEPFISDIRAVFEANGIPVVYSAAQLIDEANKNGEAMWAKDMAHWNEAGHAIAAAELWPPLKSMINPEPVVVDTIFTEIQE